MKALIALLICPAAFAAISIVQTPTPIASSSATVLTISYGSNLTAGNTIAACVINFNSGTNSASLSSGTATAGTFTQQKTAAYDFAQGVLSIFTAPITGSGSATLSFNSSASAGGMAIIATEISGLASSSIQDGTGGSATTPDSGGNAITSSSVTTSAANDLLLGCGSMPSPGTALNAGTGYTSINTATMSGIAKLGFEQQILTEASGVSHNAAYTFGTGQGQAGIVFVALKAATGGGATKVVHRVIGLVPHPAAPVFLAPFPERAVTTRTQ